MDNAKNIVNHMFQHDAFSQWLGIKVKETSPGRCIASLTVRQEMTNGFGIAHGGITYSLADSVLAFAANGYGKMQVSLETSISHFKPCKTGDELTATAEEINKTKRTAHYQVDIINQNNEHVARFTGVMHNTQKDWEIND